VADVTFHGRPPPRTAVVRAVATVGGLVKLLMIVNPFASSVTARGRVLITKALSADHEVQVVETRRRGHATRFAQDASRRDIDVVISLGGDGTLNETANGLIGTSTALAVLPGGSTNVFARTIGLPNDPVASTSHLIEALEAKSIKPVGLGSVNGRAFLFHTGIGFDAAVVREVERRASLKRWAGHPLFMYAGLSTWLRDYRQGAPRFTITSDGQPVMDNVAFAIILNTNPYTFLGNRPLDLSPAATLDRGLVAVGFRTLKAATLVRAISVALKGGGVPISKAIGQHTDVTHAVMSSPVPIPYQVDGDDLADARKLDFKHLANAVQLVMPLVDR
jgi:diacylglycerol kinase family enzyme